MFQEVNEVTDDMFTGWPMEKRGLPEGEARPPLDLSSNGQDSQ